MKADQPSTTATGLALSRAVHQVLDRPVVFPDAVAARILGPGTAEAILAAPRKHGGRFARALRAFAVARSRVVEDALREAVNGGVRQYVILGAGLDTFAYRNPYPQLRVFE
ncbi:MAG: SAM-dependent methyltransferase, partial [Ramlibacter sp.]|nr:SAM-dependent methyltransferase [Ramlibacter sp.]